MQRSLFFSRSRRLSSLCRTQTLSYYFQHSSSHNLYRIGHKSAILHYTQTHHQSTSAPTSSTVKQEEHSDGTKQEDSTETKANTDNANEETDEEKNRAFKRRWAMYISGALSAAFIYKVCKSPLQYTTLPEDISDDGLSFRSFLFSNVLANRALSRICAPWTEKQIPIKWRKRIYSAVGLFWDVSWHEFKPNLEYYPTFKHFFIRPLEYPRTLAKSDMISPSDGRVLTFGEIDRDKPVLEQIKGVTFKLPHFLYGYDGKEMHANMLDAQQSNGNKLYYTIIYLAPGDYHRFHAPSNGIKIKCINHIVGDLYAVKPSWLKKIPGLFTLNERIVLSGTWREDLFFAYVPVGAFNVGTICLTADDAIKTNQKTHDADVWYKNNGENRNKKNDVNVEYTPYEQSTPQTPFIKKYIQHFGSGEEIEYEKGDEIGYFAFGSTIVLVFEAPNFKFHIEPNQKIKYGDSLGDIVYD